VGGGKITVYNERTDSWEAMTDMQTAREQALVAAVNEKMMVVGGMVESSARGRTETDLVDILC
jgi:N-acetylneuraminic acid mutarotase